MTDQIPVIIWSGLASGFVGGLIALIGVAVQNRAHLRRLREELNHDAKQRRVEREMAMRREIYLEAAVSLAKYQEYLTSFSNLNITDEQRQTIIQGGRGALNKVHLVGSLETIEALDKAEENFGLGALNMAERTGAITLIKHRISEIDMNIQQINQRRDFNIETVNKIREIQGVDKAAATDAVLKIIDEASKEIEEQFRLRDEEQRKLENAQIEMINASAAAAFEFGTPLINAVLMARRELGFEIDEGKYQLLLGQSGKRLNDEVNSFMERMVQMYRRELGEGTDADSNQKETQSAP